MKLVVSEVREYDRQQILLRHLVINGKTYDLKISEDHRGNGINIEFLNERGQCEFSAGFSDRVRLSRHVYRPNHDHDDLDSFYVLEDGKSYWSDDFPHDQRIKGIEFGAQVDTI